MTQALTQRHSIDPLHLDSAFWFNFIVGLFMTIAGIVAAPWIAAVFGVPALTAVIRVISLIFFINPWILVQTALLQRELHFKAIAIRTISANLAGGFLGVLCALRGFGAWSLVIQILANTLVSAVALWQLSPWRPRLRFSLSHLRDLLGFGVNVTGTSLLGFLNNRLPQLLIGYFLGPIALGYFNVANRFLEFARDLFYNTVIPVIFSAFSRLQKEPDKLAAHFYGALRLAALVVLPFFFGMAILSDQIIYTFVGTKWLPAGPLLFVLSFGGIFQVLLSLNGSLLQATGKSGTTLIFGLATSALATAVMVAYARDGAYVIMLQRLFLSLLFLPLNWWVLQRWTPVTWKGYLFHIRLPLFAATLMLLVVGLTETTVLKGWNPIAQLVLLSGLGALAYGLIVNFISPSLLGELRTLSRELTLKQT